MKWEEFVKKLFEMAEPYLAVRGDLLHTQVAHDYALLLMEKEGGDKRIVEPAIILHDVGWSRVDPEDMEGSFGLRAAGEKAARINRLHELEGAIIARELLGELKYDASLIDQIITIVERHDSGREPKFLEEKLIKDADKLWRYSSVGNRIEIERQKLTPLERYKYLVRNLPSWFFTKTAKEVAERELEKFALEYEKDLLPE
jgi:HD superfamily phosphodiesterase